MRFISALAFACVLAIPPAHAKETLTPGGAAGDGPETFWQRIGLASNLPDYQGPLSIPISGTDLTLTPGAQAIHDRDLRECVVQVSQIHQSIDWQGIGKMAVTGGVQGFVMGLPAYGATKNLRPAELTGGGQAVANAAQGASNDWSFLGDQKQGWVDSCMQSRALLSHAYTVLR